MISRRTFVALTGGAVIGSQISMSADKFPFSLDHILLGCSDLDRGITFVEEHTGVRAAVGGVHPGRGTCNALLSLGERHYLEIIALDPKQDTNNYLVTKLKALSDPRLVGWAAHVSDMDAFAQRIRAAGLIFDGPTPGSRARPDGKVLHWSTLNLADDRGGLLPFFIEWSADSVHPSVDAVTGCHLQSFSAADSDPDKLAKMFQQLGLEVTVHQSAKPELRARIAGPKGVMEAIS